MIEPVVVCRMCGGTRLTPFLNFGEQPFANALIKNPSDPDPRFPLAVLFCDDCSLVQLTHKASEKELFSNYVWISGTSKAIHTFSDTFSTELLKRSIHTNPPLVVEIASNDGTMLRPFKKRGMQVLGIDPAQNIAAMAIKTGIPTEAAFWNTDTAEELVRNHGPIKVLFARNVLPHVSDQRNFVKALSLALAEDGTLALEVHYAEVILRDLHYDSIYHEHHCYFSLKTLEKLLEEFGLYLFDIVQSPINAGNVIVYARSQKITPSPALTDYRAAEDVAGVNTLSAWQDFARRSIAHRETILALLNNIVAKGKKITGYGASARGSTMLNFCGINNTVISSIADKSPLKQGLFTAGTHIPIMPIKDMLTQHPDTILILAWNFKDEIIGELREFGYTGDFLIPFPAPHIA